MSKYLHLSLDMRSDIEVMLAKNFRFNKIVWLSLYMYVMDAQIETRALMMFLHFSMAKNTKELRNTKKFPR